MKFEYDAGRDRDECVAYIDRDGDLMLKRGNGGSVWITKLGVVYGDHSHWNPSYARHKFYPGDKLTITF